MALEKILKKGKKAVATTAIVSMLGISGCATTGYRVGPSLDINNKSVGLYITNKRQNDSNKSWTTTQKILLGAAAVGAGVLIYNATKSNKVNKKESIPNCPEGYNWDGYNCI